MDQSSPDTSAPPRGSGRDTQLEALSAIVVGQRTHTINTKIEGIELLPPWAYNTCYSVVVHYLPSSLGKFTTPPRHWRIHAHML